MGATTRCRVESWHRGVDKPSGGLHLSEFVIFGRDDLLGLKVQDGYLQERVRSPSNRVQPLAPSHNNLVDWLQ